MHAAGKIAFDELEVAPLRVNHCRCDLILIKQHLITKNCATSSAARLRYGGPGLSEDPRSRKSTGARGKFQENAHHWQPIVPGHYTRRWEGEDDWALWYATSALELLVPTLAVTVAFGNVPYGDSN